MKRHTIYKEVEVEIEVDLGDFDTEDLVEELVNRDYSSSNIGINELIEKIYINRREKKDYQYELDQLIYASLGKII